MLTHNWAYTLCCAAAVHLPTSTAGRGGLLPGNLPPGKSVPGLYRNTREEKAVFQLGAGSIYKTEFHSNLLVCKAGSSVTSLRKGVWSVKGSGSCLQICLKSAQKAVKLPSDANMMATCSRGLQLSKKHSTIIKNKSRTIS